jgi:hypothetical protein
MPKFLENSLDALSAFRRNRWRAQSSKAAFSRRGLIPKSPDPQFLKEIDQYWNAHLGRKVNPLWHLACATVTGKQDVRFIPHDVWLENVLPTFNRMEMRPTYLDKNLVDVLIGKVPGPQTAIKRIHGRYYGPDDRSLTSAAARSRLASLDGELIIKGSRTDDGANISAIRVEGGQLSIGGHAVRLEDLERSHGSDFIVQERIKQSPAMAEPHPSSVNTVRIATFRWGSDIRVLVAFARFGVGGKLTDNAGTGGICCGIGADGTLSATGVDEYGGTYSTHPTSGYDFSRRQRIPNFERMCDLARKLHEKIFHFDIVSWDFATREDDSPVFLEMNFQGVSYIYQFAWGAPLFGDLTDEVLARVRARRGS